MSSIMWAPTERLISKTQMIRFVNYINKHYDIKCESYNELYEWSIKNIELFWEALWDFSELKYHTAYESVVDDINKMPGAKWFLGSKLNFAENLLKFKDDNIAIRSYSENGKIISLTYRELYIKVAQLTSSFKKSGVKKGDRICGFIPNISEAIIAMLAASSIGAIWSSCSPDFGIKGALDRFKQIDPKILITSDGYSYNGKEISLLKKIKGIVSELDSLQTTIIVPFISKINSFSILNSINWNEYLDYNVLEIFFEPLPFDHPLYIMYSSGTTGIPKSIVHSAGGTLLQHIKELKLHTDIKRSDIIFYYTTCGWMMWNWLVSSLYLGSTIVLYDGSPFYPDGSILHNISDELGITVFGTSAKYISSLEKSKIKPKSISSFPKLRTILSTGSPLVENNFDYVYKYWKQDVQLASISGGTDIISCFALGNPILPVYKGELQCRGLGMKVEAFDSKGLSVKNFKGELVCTKAFPSMPIYFWNDSDGKKYFSAYFDKFSNYWHHGDYIEINDYGGVKIFGRSDTTLNPGGIRIGTSEIYETVEKIDQIEDSLVISQKWDDDERIILFIKLKSNIHLTSKLNEYIKNTIKNNCTFRHVPAKIIKVKGIPYTINGKKVELAVKQLIQNEAVENRDSLINPEVLDYYKNINEINV